MTGNGRRSGTRFFPVRAAALVATAAVTLAGCTSFKDASKENFTRAIDAYYAGHSECLFPGALSFPYQITTNEKQAANAPTVRQLDTLTDAGLLTRIEEPALHVKRYSLTPFGARVGGGFCFGHREVASIVSFTPPAAVDGRPTTQVTYSYVMRDVPGWAKNTPVQKAFPQLAAKTTGNAQDTATLALMVNGWHIPE